MPKVAICFSRELVGNTPLAHVGSKLPVYLGLLNLWRQQGWESYVVTRKTYQGRGLFLGSWLYNGNEFQLLSSPVKVDLVYDRTAGLKFPPEADSLVVVNNLEFKKLSYDKWATYRKIGRFMAPTYLLENKNELPLILPKIKTDWAVLKPKNGQKGFGIFVGPKHQALGFSFPDKYPDYLVQEFIDTKVGIPDLVSGLHDLRVVIVNNKIVWSHVRTPPSGSFTANVARGGDIKEIPVSRLPDSVVKITRQITAEFYREYDNPIYSLDFGFGPEGPRIFEINDTIGFPGIKMIAKDDFLRELVINFAEKLKLT